jgi:hypothetical protein
MAGRTAFKTCLTFTVLIVAATNIAQAKIIQSDRAASNATDRQALEQYFNSLPNEAPGAPGDSRTIMLNFGPLHFQEVFSPAPKACPI